MLQNCNKGIIAPVEVINPDCPCPEGILSITQSADKTKLYITYTNGTTQTFILPAGPAGPQGATGAQGAAGANGTTNLWNDFTAGSSTGTGSLQILNPASQIVAANTLKNIGDSLKLRYIFSCATPQNNQACDLTLTGQDITGYTSASPNMGLFSGNNYNRLIYDILLTMTGATTANVDVTQWVMAALATGYGLTGTMFQITFGVTGLNFGVAQNLQALGLNPSGKAVVTYNQGRADLFVAQI